MSLTAALKPPRSLARHTTLYDPSTRPATPQKKGCLISLCARPAGRASRSSAGEAAKSEGEEEEEDEDEEVQIWSQPLAVYFVSFKERRHAEDITAGALAASA